MKNYFVYIIANERKTIYIGVTNDLERRVLEHKSGLIPGFSWKYRLKKLVYVEECNDISEAIGREKQLKGWLRRKKVALIETINPNWDDLAGKEQ